MRVLIRLSTRENCSSCSRTQLYIPSLSPPFRLICSVDVLCQSIFQLNDCIGLFLSSLFYFVFPENSKLLPVSNLHVMRQLQLTCCVCVCVSIASMVKQSNSLTEKEKTTK